MRARLTGLLLTCAAFCAHAAAPNLVANGSFETGDFNGWTPVADQSFNAVICAPGFGSAGDCAGIFGAIGVPSGIAQSIDGLTPGDAYTVSFAFNASGDVPSSISVSFGSAVLLELSSPAATTPAFTAYRFDVVAAASSQTLTFTFTNDANFGILDDVAVSAVPETASATLLGIGLAGLGVLRRRARRLAASRAA